MNKTLQILTFFTSLLSFSQVTLFEDDFESYPDFAINNIGSWTLTDVDKLRTYTFKNDTPTFPGMKTPMAFIVFNTNQTTPPLASSGTSNWNARSGDKGMGCFAAIPSSGNVNNDWIISPKIQLSNTGNKVSFWAKSCNQEFQKEVFNVGVSTTDTNVSSFTTIASNVTTVFGPYVEYTYNLDNYADQNVYISINCISNDQFGFMVDDFKVTADAGLNNQSFILNDVKVYPNPCKDLLNIESNSENLSKVSISDLNGRIVKEATTNLSQISIKDLSKGIYSIIIESDKGKKSEKLIIE